jgi:transposase
MNKQKSKQDCAHAMPLPSVGVRFCLPPAEGNAHHPSPVGTTQGAVSSDGKGVGRSQGYTGKGREWIKEHMGWDVEIVRHSWSARGQWVPHGNLSDRSTVWFSYERIKAEPKKFRGMLPRCWVVERAFVWMGRSRRMSNDYEYVTSRSERRCISP